MKRTGMKRAAALLLVLCMLLSLVPLAGFTSADDGTVVQQEETAAPAKEGTAETEGAEAPSDAAVTQEKEESETPESEEPVVNDYATFLMDLKKLDEYAAAFASNHSNYTANQLVLNFVRTGVERYTSGTWTTVCGQEITDFKTFVQSQDNSNSTHVMDLKSINAAITVPNGDVMDLGHVFGMMDVAYSAVVGKAGADSLISKEDLGGWAGDTADLMYCCIYVTGIENKVDASEKNVETLAAAIKSRYLGADYGTLNEVEHSFTSTDLLGDLDGYYFINELTTNSSATISKLFEERYTASLTNEQRAAYFMNHRLYGAVKRETIRARLLKYYQANTLVTALEASYGVTGEANNHDTLQKACVYAFADWLFEKAGNQTGTDGEEPKSGGEDAPDNGYYEVFSSTETTLAPGVTQNVKKALTKDKKQIVYYVATADVTRNDVNIYANYAENDGSKWDMSSVSSQMKAAEAKHSNIPNYSAVVGVNADFFDMSTGQPSGALVMEGKEYQDAKNSNFFAILKDGKPYIGSASEYASMKDNIQEAVGGSIFLVKDGKSVTGSSAAYYNSRASRTCVGITADGKVVLMVLDGRQEPWSAGGSAEEIAQIMVDAGCVTAINLDGGGSSTYDAKQEGSNEITVVNRPSDGYERRVSSSLVVVSTAENSKEFDHALINTPTDYITNGSTFTVSAIGVSKSGGAAEVPDGSKWSVSDKDLGSIDENGVFKAASDNRKSGNVRIELLSADGKVLGSKSVNVVNISDENVKVSFTKKSIDVVKSVDDDDPTYFELPVAMTYNGNAVTFRPGNVNFSVAADSGDCEVHDGKYCYYAWSDVELRADTVSVWIYGRDKEKATINVYIYDPDEASYDFDNAMYGGRDFSWNRTVSNSTYTTEMPLDGNTLYTYYSIDPKKPMETDYTFAIDMQTVPVPAKLQPLFDRLFGASADVSAWDALLKLAGRIGTKTHCTVQFKFDEDLNIDYKDLTVKNDLFKLSDATLDKSTNTLTVVFSWKGSDALDSEGASLNKTEANPIAIFSGIKLTPKDGVWDEKDQISITNSGSLSYDIYLGASAIYSMANDENFQKEFGIYPDDNIGNKYRNQGGHFVNENFKTFEDTYYLNNKNKNGWEEFNGNVYYFKDNKPLTGIQKLPGYNDEGNTYFYDLGENGVYTGKLTGLVQYNGSYYYSVMGVAQTGWQEIDGENYYFNSDGRAQTDEKTFKIKDYYNSHKENVTYKFDNNGKVHGTWKYVTYGDAKVGDRTAGTRYYYGEGYYFTNSGQSDHPLGKLYTIDGKQYGFDRNGFRYEGITLCYDERTADAGSRAIKFSSEGVYEGIVDTGYVKTSDGRNYYIIGGKAGNADGIYEQYYDKYGNQVDSIEKAAKVVYYSFKADGRPTKMCATDTYKTISAGWWDKRSVTWSQAKSFTYPEKVSSLETGTYYFDKNGQYVRDLNNGIVKGDDGNLRYYTVKVEQRSESVTGSNGKVHNEGYFHIVNDPIAAGLVVTYYDRNGAETSSATGAVKAVYHFFGSDKIGAKDKDVQITAANSNGLLPDGTYHFDANGEYTVTLQYAFDLYCKLSGADGSEGAKYFISHTKLRNLGGGVRLTTSATYSDGTHRYVFDHWEYNGKSYGSRIVTFRPTDPGTYEACACYVLSDETKTETPSVELTETYPEYVSGKYKIASTMNYTIPDGYTLLRAGILVSSKNEQPDLQNTSPNMISESNKLYSSAAYTVHINATKYKDTDFYLRAFIVVEHGGIETTLYSSDVVKCNYNALANANK